MSETRRTPLEVLRDSPKSKRAAINAMCYDCQGEGHDPEWRWRVGNCEVGEKCPLYNFRPYQEKHGTEVPAQLRFE